MSTEASSIPIIKMVSPDLRKLSARVEQFVDNMEIDVKVLDAIMLEQKTTGALWECEV